MRGRARRSAGAWKSCARRWIRFVYCSRSALAQQELVRPCRCPGDRRCGSAYRADAGAVPLRAAYRLAGGRGSPNQRAEAEGKALAAPARSVRGGHDQAAGMVRGGTVARIARIVSSGCRQSIPACIRMGNCEHASGVSRNGGVRPLFNWYSGPRRSTLSTWVARTNARLWCRWSAITLWICRCAWTTLARRPQLHRVHNNNDLVQEKESWALMLCVSGTAPKSW